MKNPLKRRRFGPFWGELGWEVAQWAPYVNARVREDDVVRCMPGHAELYAFAGTTEQAHPRPMGREPDMLDPWPGLAGDKPPIGVVKGVPCIDAEIWPVPLYPACSMPRSMVVLHCRGISKCSERNLAPDVWDTVAAVLISLGHEVAVVGTLFDYRPSPVRTDARGASLYNTIKFMREARLVVGASSGPMHLAQACEAPIAVWSGNAGKDEPRYKEVWNHFGSPTKFVAPTWQPTAKEILNAIEDSV